MNDHRTTISNFLDRFALDTLDAAFAMMSEDSTWTIPGRSPVAVTLSRDDFRAQLSNLLALMPSGFRIRPTGWTVDGDRIAVEAVSEGKVVNGKDYSNQYHLLFQLEGGKIKRVTEYACSHHMLDVFGEYLGV